MAFTYNHGQIKRLRGVFILQAFSNVTLSRVFSVTEFID